MGFKDTLSNWGSQIKDYGSKGYSKVKAAFQHPVGKFLVKSAGHIVSGNPIAAIGDAIEAGVDYFYPSNHDKIGEQLTKIANAYNNKDSNNNNNTSNTPVIITNPAPTQPRYIKNLGGARNYKIRVKRKSARNLFNTTASTSHSTHRKHSNKQRKRVGKLLPKT